MAIQRKPIRAASGKVELREWTVDPEALKLIRGNDWVIEFPELAIRDLREMGESFPKWILAAGHDINPAACPKDGEYIVPKDGKLRCVKCNTPYPSPDQLRCLIWTGLIPVQITGAKKVEARIRGMIESETIRLSYMDDEQNLVINVPIKVVYPTNWPTSPPEGYYLPGFFETIGGNSGFGHDTHMLDKLKMCLFRDSDWRRRTIRGVIENRILLHAAAHVLIANGERPKKWFS